MKKRLIYKSPLVEVHQVVVEEGVADTIASTVNSLQVKSWNTQEIVGVSDDDEGDVWLP
ncbi:MAG: hypothetical protein LBB64_04000 [Dysgonamonadaceae bacterium]|jgi:hypothetical protein|nr:hypothetical protein [Dysgonamonadaceae bacterium]